MTTYLDETLQRIQSHDGVVGTLVMTSDGVIIKTTLDQATASEYSQYVADVCERSRNSSDDLTYLRLRTKRNEWIIVPGKDYIWATIKAPTE